MAGNPQFVVDIVINLTNNMQKVLTPINKQLNGMVKNAKALRSTLNSITTKAVSVDNTAKYQAEANAIKLKSLATVQESKAIKATEQARAVAIRTGEVARKATEAQARSAEAAAKRVTAASRKVIKAKQAEMDQIIRTAKSSSKFFRAAFGEIEGGAKKATGAMNKFDFSALGVMFAGMALQRVFGNMFRSIISGYTDFAAKNDVFANKVLELSGAFTFLKYTIGKAFAQSEFIQNMIDKVILGIDAISKWANEHQKAAAAIVILIGALFLLGIALAFIGQVSLGLGAMKAFFTPMKLYTGLINLLLLPLKILAATFWIISKVTLVSKGAFTILGSVIKGLFTLILANPIVALIIAIIAIAAAFSKWREEINRTLEKFGFLGNLVRYIGNLLATAFNYIIALFKNLGPVMTWLVEKFAMVKDKFVEIVGAIADKLTILKPIFSAIGKFFSGIGEDMKKAADVTEDWNEKSADVAGLWQDDVEVETGVTNKVAETATDMPDFTEGLSSGLTDMNLFQDSFDTFNVAGLTSGVDISTDAVDGLTSQFDTNMLAQNSFATSIADTVIPALSNEETKVYDLIEAYRQLNSTRRGNGENLGGEPLQRDGYAPLK